MMDRRERRARLVCNQLFDVDYDMLESKQQLKFLQVANAIEQSDAEAGRVTVPRELEYNTDAYWRFASKLADYEIGDCDPIEVYREAMQAYEASKDE